MAKKTFSFHLFFFLNKNVTKQDYILHGCNQHCMQLSKAKTNLDKQVSSLQHYKQKWKSERKKEKNTHSAAF